MGVKARIVGKRRQGYLQMFVEAKAIMEREIPGLHRAQMVIRKEDFTTVEKAEAKIMADERVKESQVEAKELSASDIVIRDWTIVSREQALKVRLVVKLISEKARICSCISVSWDLGGRVTKSRNEKQMKRGR